MSEPFDDFEVVEEKEYFGRKENEANEA